MFKFFEENPEILAVMSEKKDGQMKLFERGSVKNRKKFFKKLGMNPKDVVSADVCHGKKVVTIRNNKKKIISKTDALVTNQAGIFLSITVADCVPVLMFSKNKKIIAVAHAGWRSTLKNIIYSTIEKIEKLGGNVNDLKVEIGPGIGQCHFEIGKDVINKFGKYKKFIKIKNEKYLVDLKEIIKFQLEKNGVRKENIKTSKSCTYCDEKYFSARRDKNKRVEAGVVVIGKIK
ncbi:MAG: peptidoglycan editing factor PgeF [bacterium]|nr:peptidoglycan editing factor PgeF [bacterium]